jgi:DNA primase
MLRRFASKTVLCYDPDAAGQGAAERSCELLVSEGFDVNVAVLPGGQDPDTFLQTQGRPAYVAELRRSKPYLDFLLDRAADGQDLSRDDARREFLRKMLAVAARIPDPASRDQFADRLAHKARVTEEVVRQEIRRAAAQKKTELPAERARSLSAPLRDVERGILWAIVHTPEDAVRALVQLELADFEGLRSQDLLEKALNLVSDPDNEFPNALMERLTDQEAQLLAKVATEREPPVRDLATCIQVLQFGRIERQLLAIQQEIDRARRDRGSDAAVDELLRDKNRLRTALEHARRGPRDVYNK